MIVCLGFVVCWSSNQIFYFLSFIGHDIDHSNWVYYFSIVLVYANSCINPFIYAAKYSEFQRGVRRLVSRLSGNPEPSQTQQSIVIINVQVISNPTYQQTQDTTGKRC